MLLGVSEAVDVCVWLALELGVEEMLAVCDVLGVCA